MDALSKPAPLACRLAKPITLISGGSPASPLAARLAEPFPLIFGSAVPTQSEALQSRTPEPAAVPARQSITLPAQAGNYPNPSADSRRGNQTTTPPMSVKIVRESAKAILLGYAGLVAKNTAIRPTKENWESKALLAREAAAIYSTEISRNQLFDGLSISEALQGADFSDPANNAGTLSGTLILQRVLDRFQYEFPELSAVTTDFSAEPGVLHQTTNAHIVLTPAVQTYDTSTDSSGRPKGWSTVSPAQTIDAPITLDEYVGIPIVFGAATLSSTMRNLFEEIAPQALYALGKYMVNKTTNLLTPANFNAYVSTGDAAGQTVNLSTALIVGSTAGLYPGQVVSGAGIPANTFILSVTDGTHAVMNNAATATAAGVAITYGTGKVPTTYTTYIKALADFNLASLDDAAIVFDTNEVPQQNRLALLNAQYYRKLRQDPSLNQYFAAVQDPTIITQGRLPNLVGFAPYNAPYFPTSNNRVGFIGHKASILVKTRLPLDFTKAVDAQAPGNVTVVTNPSIGLSMLLVQYVNLTQGYCEMRIEAQLGAAVGDRRGGLLITSQ